MKKAVIFILLIALLIPLVSCNTSNATVYFEYKLNEDAKSYSITNVTVLIPSEVIIPKEYKKLPVTQIDVGAFSNCEMVNSIVIPETIESIKCSFENCPALTRIEVNAYNKNFRSISGNLYSKDGTKLIQYAIGKKDSSFVVPSSVEQINSSAFTCSRYLSSIEVDEHNQHYKSMDGNLYTIDGKSLIQYAVAKDGISF